jgi:hypothetical protein
MCLLSFRQRVRNDLIKNHVIYEGTKLDNETIKETVKGLLAEIGPLDEKLKDLHKALEAIRKICPHDIDDNTGHGHNYSIYECRTCGRVVHW